MAALLPFSYCIFNQQVSQGAFRHRILTEGGCSPPPGRSKSGDGSWGRTPVGLPRRPAETMVRHRLSERFRSTSCASSPLLGSEEAAEVGAVTAPSSSAKVDARATPTTQRRARQEMAGHNGNFLGRGHRPVQAEWGSFLEKVA